MIKMDLFSWNTGQMLTCKGFASRLTEALNIAVSLSRMIIKTGTIAFASAESYRINITKYSFIPTAY